MINNLLAKIKKKKNNKYILIILYMLFLSLIGIVYVVRIIKNKYDLFSFSIIFVIIVVTFLLSLFIKKDYKVPSNVSKILCIIIFLSSICSLLYGKSDLTAAHIINSKFIALSELKSLVSFSFLFILGFLFQWSANKKYNILKMSIYSFIIGCALWVVISAFVVFTQLPYTGLTMIIFIVLMILFIILKNKPKKLSLDNFVEFVLYLIIFNLLTLLFSRFHFGTFSYDSFQYINYGLNLGLKSGINNPVFSAYLVGSYAFALPSLNSISFLFGFVSFHLIQTIIFVNFVFLFLFEFYFKNSNSKYNKKYSIVITFLAGLLLIANSSFLIIGLSHLNNMVTMVFMFALMVFLEKIDHKSGISYEAILLLCALLFTRIEMPLYCFLIILLVTTKEVSQKQMKFLYLVPFFLLFIYYVGYFTIFGFAANKDFLSISKAIFIVVLYVLLGLYLKLIWNKNLIKKQNVVRYFIFFGLILLFVFLTFLDINKSFYNIGKILRHLFLRSYSGFTWILMFSAIPLMLKFKINKLDLKKFEIHFLFIISSILFILIIFLFREMPLRVGTFDSGNRLIFQIYPVVIFVFMSLLYTGCFTVRSNDEKK